MTSTNELMPESREDIPLKSGARTTTCCSEDCLGGSRFINFAFGTLTLVITVALVVQIYYGDYQVTPHGSVATDNFNCSKIGTSILKQDGNAVDAAIASAFCLAVTNPHLTGLDAEGQILIYNHRARTISQVIDFTGSNIVSESVPRLVLGLAYIHQQFGSLDWKKLVQPSVDLASKGFLVPKTLVQAIKTAKAEHLYGNLEVGQEIILDKLGETLQKIADIPESELYSYIKITNQPILTQGVKLRFKNYDILVPNLMDIDNILLTTLEAIGKLNYTVANAAYVYDIVNIIKSSYDVLNVTNKFHEGTSSNVAIMDLHDNYVSLVTGMHSLFGSGELTSAGYILDNRNLEKASTRIPIILTDAQIICGKRMVFGANDLSVAVQLIISLVIEKQNATEGIEAPRFHILSDNTLGLEGFPSAIFNQDTLRYLHSRLSPILLQEPYSSSNVVEKLKDDLSSHSDSRGGGIASRF